MNYHLHKKGWSQRLHWEYDERLDWGWKRLALAAGIRHPSDVRSVYEAVCATHNSLCPKSNDFAPITLTLVAKRAGVHRNTARRALEMLVESRFIERKGTGDRSHSWARYRPNRDLRDPKQGWANANFLFEQVPEKRRTAVAAGLI